MSDQIQPLRDYVTIRLIPEGFTESGIALPEGVRLKNRAMVVAVGEGYMTASGTIVPLSLKPGDFVIAFTPPGTPVLEQSRERGDLLLCRYEHIFAVDRREPDVITKVEAPRLVQ